MMSDNHSILILLLFLFLSEVSMVSAPSVPVGPSVVPNIATTAPVALQPLPDPKVGRLAFVRSAQQHLRNDTLDCAARDFKNWIAGKLNVSPRVAGRWLRTAQFTPLCVQQAVDDGRLDITTAEKVAGCSKEVQLEIAERIENGQNPRTAVAAHLSPKSLNPVACVRKMLSAINRCMEELDGRFDELPPVRSRDKAILTKVSEFIRNLADKAPGAGAAQADTEPEANTEAAA